MTARETEGRRLLAGRPRPKVEEAGLLEAPFMVSTVAVAAGLRTTIAGAETSTPPAMRLLIHVRPRPSLPEIR